MRVEKPKYTYRNVYSGATFTVTGEEAALRMDSLAGWRCLPR